MQRFTSAIELQEPDRIPLLLLLSLHGARELGLPIREYYSRAENVAEAQLRMRNRFHHDCLYAFYYSAIEFEAWGGKVIFRENGPANAGEPFIRDPGQINDLAVPVISQQHSLTRVLKSIEILKAEAGDEVPILGVVMSPFSLPVMQMGFGRYLELIYENLEMFTGLMRVNEEFCVAWANAQLNAGATAICYFDPVSSTTIIPGELYLRTGFEVARRTISRIKGPVCTHFSSGRCLSILDRVSLTGTKAVGVGSEDDIRKIKEATRGKIAVVGNLNGISMRRWTRDEAELKVKQLIRRAGIGGGFILADSHGEIPLQVKEETLSAISDAVFKWGRYPLDWI